MKPVIICGGVGTKMWPESRQALPKHFLPLLNNKSLFQINWEVLRKKFEPKDIYIQTTRQQVALALEQEPEVIISNIFVEPEMKNQGPATGFAAAKLFRNFPDEPFMLVQADDLRDPPEKFLEMMEVCDRLAKETGKYITGGIKSSFGLMGVDYLVPGERVSKEGEAKVFKVDKFLWRDTKEKAEEYVHQMNALVHTNHTCMTPRAFLEMLKKYKPEWYEPLMNIVNGGNEAEEFAKMPKGPLEDVTQQVHANGESLVVELPFEWIDFGTWESLMRYVTKNGLNSDDGIQEIEATGNYVRKDEGKHVAIIGVNDLVVIDTADALLICRKDQTGRVGEIVEGLKKEDKTELL